MAFSCSPKKTGWPCSMRRFCMVHLHALRSVVWHCIALHCIVNSLCLNLSCCVVICDDAYCLKVLCRDAVCVPASGKMPRSRRSRRGIPMRRLHGGASLSWWGFGERSRLRRGAPAVLDLVIAEQSRAEQSRTHPIWQYLLLLLPLSRPLRTTLPMFCAWLL